MRIDMRRILGCLCQSTVLLLGFGSLSVARANTPAQSTVQVQPAAPVQPAASAQPNAQSSSSLSLKDVVTLNLAIIGGGITIFATGAGLGRYFRTISEEKQKFAQEQMKAEQEKLKTELDITKADNVRISKENQDLAKAERQLLFNGLHLILKADYEQLEISLNRIVDEIGASCFGVFVPDPDPANRPQGVSRDLAFLWGSGPHRGKWWNRRINVDGESKAAKVFRNPSGEGAIKEARGDEPELIALPYPTDTNCKAVIEFVNKYGGARFTQQSIATAKERIRALAVDEKIHYLLTDMPTHDRVLEKRSYSEINAVILVADISAFSQTLLDVNEESMVPFLRLYFSRMCEIAFASGGAIEALLGDGLLVSYNVQSQLTGNYLSRAVEAALKMQEEFRSIRQQFLDTAALIEGNKLFHRIGIARGPLIRAELGDRRSMRECILGRVVNEATKLCDQAPRDVDCIIYMQDVKTSVGGVLGTDPKWTEEDFHSDTLERIGITGGRKVYVSRSRP